MEYIQFSQEFKNLLNRVVGMMKAYEPNNIEISAKTILNVFKDEYKIKELTDYSAYADKVEMFLFHSKFIERCDERTYILTDKGMKVKELGSFEKYYEWEKTEKERSKNKEILEYKKLERSVKFWKDPKWYWGILTGSIGTLLIKELVQRFH